jgi:hypothetical protein
MGTADLAVVIATIVANAGIGVADLAHAPFVLANSAEVHIPRTWLPVLGGLKIAGALGLLACLFGVRPLGVAAAIGLVLFFVGALVAHVRAGMFRTIAFPGAYLAPAVVSLVAIGR